MRSDRIFTILEHQAKLKCGELWNVMNNNEKNIAMLEIAILIIKSCEGVNDDINS